MYLHPTLMTKFRLTEKKHKNIFICCFDSCFINRKNQYCLFNVEITLALFICFRIEKDILTRPQLTKRKRVADLKQFDAFNIFMAFN